MSVSATSACASEAESDASSTISEDGPYDHHGADACSVASSDGGSSTASAAGAAKCTRCKAKKDPKDFAFICCLYYRECMECAIARGVDVESTKIMRCGRCKKAKDEKKSKKKLDSVSPTAALGSIAEESQVPTVLPVATPVPQQDTIASLAATSASPRSTDVNEESETPSSQ